MWFNKNTNPPQWRHFVEAVKRQATKDLEVFFWEIIVSTEISVIELSFDNLNVIEFGLKWFEIVNEEIKSKRIKEFILRKG